MGEAVNIIGAVKPAQNSKGLLETAFDVYNAHRNEETQRMFAENAAARESAKELREKQKFDQEQEDKKRTRAIEQAHAVQTIGMLHATNPGAAGALADAYGIQLNPLTAAVPAAHESSFDEQLNQALGSAPSGGIPPVAAAQPSSEPVYEGPRESPELEARMQALKPDANLEHLMTSASFSAPQFEGSAETAPKEPPAPTNPLFEAVVNGHHYPLPTRSAGTGLGDKYDTLYQHATANLGMTDEQAKAFVLKTFKDDNSAGNIATRMADEIGKREAAKEQYGAKFVPSAEQRQENFGTTEAGRNSRNAANNKTKIEVAGMMGGPRQEQADTGKRTQYMGVVKDYVGRVGANKDIAVLKNLSKIKGELSPDLSLSTQNAAADTLAQIAQGGKASQSVMNAFNNHSLGIAQTLYDKAYQAGHNGRHSPAWIESHNQTVRDLKQTYDEITRGEANTFEDAAGNRSAYANDPEVGPHVQEQRRTFYQTLGLKAPDEGPSDSEKLAAILNHLEIK